MSAIKHLYVNIPDEIPNFSTISEALDSLDTAAITEQRFPASNEKLSPVTIHIGPGNYREQLVITRPYVTLEGAGCDETLLVYGNYANEILADGSKRGTFRTASVRIDTHDFTARHLTIQNDAGYGHMVGQALALYVDGDRIYLEDCRLLGSQDTLFTAPLPPTEAKPGGFTGPGEHKPRIMGRHCYQNCEIRGDVDFIFGSAIAYFDKCTLFSQQPEEEYTAESGEPNKIYGYITAASTPQDEPYGYVFHHCHLVSNCPPGTVYLGRPWREYAKTVYIECELGAHIHPSGWNDWKKPHGHFYYGEYHSSGPGAAATQRASFSHQLTDAEAALYTMDNVLMGWKPY